MSSIKGSLALLGVVLLAACGEAGSSPASSDVLYLRAGSGIAVVEVGASSPSFSDKHAVTSGDWSTVVKGEMGVSSTRVVAHDPAGGTERWVATVPGRVRARVVSADGALAVLAPRDQPSHWYGRRRTQFVIVGKDRPVAQEITLDGNYEPEAFSTDGDSLFVIKYLPARAPSRYQVRRLDLTTEQVLGVYTPHDELQRSMGGTARVQAASSDGSRLYTLYTVGGSRGAQRYAFIHVLDLDQQWAHCIFLPEGFATGAAESVTGLAVSPDGKRLYAANARSGSVAEIDTERLTVTRTARSTFPRGWTHVVGDPAGTLYVASARAVTAFNGADLSERWSVQMPEPVRGLQVTRNADKLYVALTTSVASVDPTSGDTTETIDPPGVTKIGRLGPVLAVEQEPILKCAC